MTDSNYRIVEVSIDLYGASMSSYSDDLETRVSNRKHQLIAELIEHKKKSSRSNAADAIGRIEGRLAELSQIVKASEWAKLSEYARGRLVEWVAR